MKESLRIIFRLLTNSLLRPFKENALYFILVWILMSLHSVWYQIAWGNYIYSLYIFALYFIYSYFAVLLVGVIPKLDKILKPLLLLFLFIYTCLDIFCKYQLDAHVSPDIIEIILNTNINEVGSFFRMYFSLSAGIILFLILIALVLLYFWIIKKDKEKKNHLLCPVLGVAAFIFSILAVKHNPGVMAAVRGAGGGALWSFSFEVAIDLRDYERPLDISSVSEHHPAKIVVVIGESFAKNHSSLYGYEKQTNPYLEQLKEDGKLLVFDNVVSPASHTAASFKYILNTHQRTDINEKWYQSINVISVFNRVGYKTYWISNQEETGAVGNICTTNSRLCQSYWFSGKNTCYDEVLANYVRTVESEADNSLFIYHLMGQHAVFSDRFPSDYSKFKDSDYSAYKEHQRQYLADYDNSTLYNDYVISEIIKVHAAEESIVIYFPDHGLDVFVSDDKYVGHSRDNIPESYKWGVNIPFMIYVSPSFEEQNPKIVESLRKSTDKAFCTENMIFTLMDIAGYKFAQNNSVQQFSLLR